MKKVLLACATLFFVSLPSYAWQQREPLPVGECVVHNPYGFPQVSTQVVTICREAYYVGYDAAAKIPNHVTYTLYPQNALGCVARTNAFAADQSIPNGPTPQDYAGTGFDKGHQAPDGDLSWDTQVEYESFLMTNMAPQAGSLNRGIWKLLETAVRGWTVQKNQPFTIYVGAVYDGSDEKIGKGVVVPHGFYKVVIDDVTSEVAAWFFPHVPPYSNLGNDLTKFRVSIASLEQKFGVRFGFPQNAKELPVGGEWPVDFGALTNAKRAKCGANASSD